MKKVTRCHNCKQIIRQHGSFTAKLEKPELENGVLVEVIKLCRPCAARASFIVKGINDAKTLKEKEKNGV